jgi:hypothetical protein
MAFAENEDFERIAGESRRELGIEDRYCPDLIFGLNELRRLGKIKDYIPVPDERMADDALYDANEGVVHIRESILAMLDHPLRGPKVDRRRARFSIAHEIGHIKWSHEGRNFRGMTSQIAMKFGSRVRSNEREANGFAAAFLVPIRLTKPEMSAEQISEIFDVNISTARLRKKEIEKIDRRARGLRRPLPESVRKYLRDRNKPGGDED